MALKADDILIQKFDGKKLTVFDVGAKGKPFSLPGLYKYQNFHGFEPNPVEFEKLQKSKTNNSTTYYPYALSLDGGMKKINITQHASYSSLLDFDDDNFKKHFHLMKGFNTWSKGMSKEKTVSVQSKKLDELISDENINFIDFIKLDTQGTELEILKGSIDAIKRKKIGVIFSEVSFIGVYKNQNLFSDLEIFLRSHGYDFIDCRFYPESAYDIRPPFRKSTYDRTRYSVGGDAVFAPNLESSNLNQFQCFKIGVVLASLHYFGIAYNYLHKAELSQQEIRLILNHFDGTSLKSILHNWMPPAVIYILKKVLNR